MTVYGLIFMVLAVLLKISFATHEHLRLLTLLTPSHQLILCSGTLLPPVAFHRLALPPACCVADHGHSDDAEEAEAELCCGHDVPFPIAALVC
jgi:hypothetical protein